MGQRSRNQRKKSMDVDAYVRQLEDVYGIEIEFDVRTVPGRTEMYQHRLVIKAYHTGDDRATGPLCYQETLIITHPQERYEATTLHALVEFTYQCVEAHVQAIPLPAADASLAR